MLKLIKQTMKKKQKLLKKLLERKRKFFASINIQKWRNNTIQTSIKMKPVDVKYSTYINFNF